MDNPTDVIQDELREGQDARRAALIERIGYFADLLASDPLEGDKGDVAYELLRQAAAQLSSDCLALQAAQHRQEDVAGMRNLTLLEGWSAAENECKRVAAETVFTDDVSEDQRKGFQSGVSFCIAAIRIASSRIDVPLHTRPPSNAIKSMEGRMVEDNALPTMREVPDPFIRARLCGGFLALSPKGDPLKIGTTGETAQAAGDAFRASYARCVEILALRARQVLHG